jgi:hypothetical protein
MTLIDKIPDSWFNNLEIWKTTSKEHATTFTPL